MTAIAYLDGQRLARGLLAGIALAAPGDTVLVAPGLYDAGGAAVAGALALTAVITDPDTVHPREAVEVRCEAPDYEILLADWLNALVFEMATRGMLFSEFSITLEGEHLHGTARGEAVDVQRHQPAADRGDQFVARLERAVTVRNMVIHLVNR